MVRYFITLLLVLCLTTAAHAAVCISGFSDFTFGTWPGSGQMQLFDGTLCVYDSGGGRYGITATGSGAGGAFTLTNGTNTLVYSVAWKDSQGTSGTFTNMNAGNKRNFNSPNTTSATCGGSFNAALRITFAANDLSAGQPGNYSGTLTILLEP